MAGFSDPAICCLADRIIRSLETTLDTLDQGSAIVQQVTSEGCGKLHKPNAGEVAERLKAAVC
jgi:hypothetical protein